MKTRSVAEISLELECRSTIEDELEHATPSLFDEAQFLVLGVIKYDLYSQFLESDIYRHYKCLPSNILRIKY